MRSFTVPSEIDQLLVQLWGAGGGAGYDPNGLYSFSGGPGGFVQCYLKVNPGQTLYVQVGQVDQATLPILLAVEGLQLKELRFLTEAVEDILPSSQILQEPQMW